MAMVAVMVVIVQLFTVALMVHNGNGSGNGSDSASVNSSVNGT